MLTSSPSSRLSTVIAIAVICLLGLSLSAVVASQNQSGWGVDYNQFYAASHLAGTGHLYDWEALRKLELENGLEVPTGRLPVVLYGHKILSWLPYKVAFATWVSLCIGALVAFASLWPGTRTLMPMALAWSLPAALTTLYGQDVPFWMLAFTAGVLLLARKKPTAAGVAFSLCLCKFHLALGIPIFLAARREWKAFFSAAASVAVWIAASFWIEGVSWPAEYRKMASLPVFSPAVERMPNLHGIASWLLWPLAVEAVLVAAVLGLLWQFCRNESNHAVAAGAAAAAGLLLSYHAYTDDCTLLLPLAVMAIQSKVTPMPLKVWAALLLTPISALLLLSPVPWLGQILIVAFVFSALWMLRSSSARARAVT